MSKNIFVGSLAWATTSEGLERAFAKYGVVKSAKVVSDRETGRSKGFGFVEMESGGDEAIRAAVVAADTVAADAIATNQKFRKICGH